MGQHPKQRAQGPAAARRRAPPTVPLGRAADASSLTSSRSSCKHCWLRPSLFPCQFSSWLQAERVEPYTLLHADSWQVLPAVVAELLSSSNADFTVVGALGAQGLGKSAFLNALLGFSGPLPAAGPHPSPAFPTAASAALAAGRHCTHGLGLRVGTGRLIGLDAQPLFSASVLEDMMASWPDQPPPALAAPAVAAASEAKAPAVPHEGVQALAQMQLAVLVSIGVVQGGCA